MLANRRRNTAPELRVRRILHASGFRYRVDYRALPEHRWRVDIAFTRRRVAVFIDGCFWHGCPEHGTIPLTNADYWVPKLARNVGRDRQCDADYVAAGWKVLRFWEHEEPEAVARAIDAELRARDVGGGR
jgi:DNA mismatch endonuclease (patch repair protein)